MSKKVWVKVVTSPMFLLWIITLFYVTYVLGGWAAHWFFGAPTPVGPNIYDGQG